MVSLEQRETAVTRLADVVLPVAPVTDKAGTLPDLRILSGIADELGAPLGFRTTAEVRVEMESMGPWDGARPTPSLGKAPKQPRAKAGSLALAGWKQLLDHGSMQDGEVHLAATARPAVARINAATYDSLFGLLDGSATATLTGDRGSVTLPVEVVDLPDGVVWVPSNSFGRGVLADLASPGSAVTLNGADK